MPASAAIALLVAVLAFCGLVVGLARDLRPDLFERRSRPPRGGSSAPWPAPMAMTATPPARSVAAEPVPMAVAAPPPPAPSPAPAAAIEVGRVAIGPMGMPTAPLAALAPVVRAGPGGRHAAPAQPNWPLTAALVAGGLAAAWLILH